MDYLLHSNMQQTDRIVLGKVKSRKLVQSRDVRTMCITPICKGTNRVFQGEQVEGNNMFDNQRALECSAHQLRIIKPSSKCADIRLSFRATKQGLSGTFKYEHVYGNMDNYLLWHQLTIKQQLNCRHHCKKSDQNGNKARIPRHANPNITKRRCSASHKKQQDNG